MRLALAVQWIGMDSLPISRPSDVPENLFGQYIPEEFQNRWKDTWLEAYSWYTEQSINYLHSEDPEQVRRMLDTFRNQVREILTTEYVFYMGQTQPGICSCLSPNCFQQHGTNSAGHYIHTHVHPTGYACGLQCYIDSHGHKVHIHSPGEPHKTELMSFTDRERLLELERWLNNWGYISNDQSNSERAPSGGYGHRSTIRAYMINKQNADIRATYTEFKWKNGGV